MTIMQHVSLAPMRGRIKQQAHYWYAVAPGVQRRVTTVRGAKRSEISEPISYQETNHAVILDP
jgi:hypothetical protein